MASLKLLRLASVGCLAALALPTTTPPTTTTTTTHGTVIRSTAPGNHVSTPEGVLVVNDRLAVGSTWTNVKVTAGRFSGTLVRGAGGNVCRSLLSPEARRSTLYRDKETGTYGVLEC
jgi:hypothetical protein